MDKRNPSRRQAARTSHAAAEHTPPTTEAPTQERLGDQMVEETFPASDPTQLPGRADCERAGGDDAPHRDDAATHVQQREPPRTIGNQGVIPASRNLEETVALGDATDLNLRLDRDLKGLQVELTRNGAVLDTAGVDRLIAALSAKRAQMIE